jgi:PHD/YefM family antitoxin component YafN of YafNO toxin-antitoxin module
MLTANQIRTVSDFRANPKKLLDELKRSRGPFYLFYRSKLKGVLVDVDTYSKLEEIVEEYLDAKEAQEFESQDKSKIAWKEAQEVARELGIK